VGNPKPINRRFAVQAKGRPAYGLALEGVKTGHRLQAGPFPRGGEFMTASNTGQKSARFQNADFRAELTRTPAGSVRICVHRARPGGRSDSPRQVAAFIYDLAAELERRSDAIAARWAISPEAFNSRIDVELSEGEDAETATRFVVGVLGDLGAL
jgi:hypothetical protein